ncbi:MAG TPA: hypothetical protein VN843_14125 [Anaerolineales bacterium]|nr:hypothetical protein [Anaerolineales bacterium]
MKVFFIVLLYLVIAKVIRQSMLKILGDEHKDAITLLAFTWVLWSEIAVIAIGVYLLIKFFKFFQEEKWKSQE